VPGVSSRNLVKSCVEAGGDVGAVRRQQGCAARNRDLIRELADLENERDGRLRVDAHFDALHDRLLETGQLRLHFVGTGQQPLLDEQAGLVRHHGIGSLPRQAGDVDGDPWKNTAARVGDGAADTAVDRLRAD
jgi:hypothetical protein